MWGRTIDPDLHPKLKGAEVKTQDAGKPNVISLLSRRKGVIPTALAQVEAYWEALRGDALVPPRSAVNPRGIEDALEYAFILECVAPGVARFRLAGMHLNDLMGMEVRGMPLTTMFTPDARNGITEVLTAVCTRPQISQLVLKAERSIGRPGLEARLLLAPLTDDFGEVNRILGCLQSDGAIGRQPRRFRVAEVSSRHLAPARPEMPAAPDLKHAGFAELPRHYAGLAESKRPTAARPALRVVSSND